MNLKFHPQLEEFKRVCFSKKIKKSIFFHLQQRLIIVLKKERRFCKRCQQVFNKSVFLLSHNGLHRFILKACF